VGIFRKVLDEVLTTPGLVRSVRMRVKKGTDGSLRTMEGIVSNLYGNPVIDGVVVSGWIKKE